MKQIACPHRKWKWKWFWAAFGVLAAAGGVPEGLAQGAGAPTGPPVVSPLSPTAPPELVKPALPSEFKRAESVFKKLDVANRGYVTLDDTKDLIGFEEAFKAADTKGSGQLTLAQFKKAWSIYTEKQ